MAGNPLGNEEIGRRASRHAIPQMALSSRTGPDAPNGVPWSGAVQLRPAWNVERRIVRHLAWGVIIGLVAMASWTAYGDGTLEWVEVDVALRTDGKASVT